MATIKSFTDLPQSKILSKILPIESADMNYWCGTQIRIGGHRTMDKDLDVPCWSLSALLSVLPEGYSFIITKSFNGKDYYCKLDGKPIETMADNPVDACVAMIEKLNELKML